ncbi:hypothetical protein D046_8241B, partial [Vibrio parahaemolyticus V-223/04]
GRVHGASSVLARCNPVPILAQLG